MKIRHVLLIISFLSIVGWGPFIFLNNNSNDNILMGTKSWVDTETRILGPQAGNLNPEVLRLSLTAYSKAKQRGLVAKPYLTIVDYSKPSSERRLWVVDVKHQKVLFNTWVAHGKNSGDVNATSFSNDARSLKSSLGVYVTEDIYSGKHGDSLRIQGLERGFNDHAYDRAIVFHGASYASQNVATTHGRLGRSWGCMAVGENIIHPLINTIKDKTVVVAYYPDRNWLRHSSYLTT